APSAAVAFLIDDDHAAVIGLALGFRLGELGSVKGAVAAAPNDDDVPHPDDAAHRISLPPSTTSTVPVVYALVSRNRTAATTSSGVPRRCSGVVSAKWRCVASSHASGSSTGPGATAVTVRSGPGAKPVAWGAASSTPTVRTIMSVGAT